MSATITPESVPLEPGAPRPRARTWWLIALVLLLCIPPMVVALRGLATPRVMEGVAVTSSQETWLQLRGSQDGPADPNVWLRPTWGGQPRVVKPPLVLWLNLLAWSDLTPSNSTPAQLLIRARIVSLVMTSIMLAAVFFIGRLLVDQWMGLLAALILGTMWFVQREGRSGAYDIHLTAWATAAVAFALSSIRPFDAPSPRSRWWGWAAAGICLAGAWLTKGPLALLFVLLPVVTLVALAPRGSRGRHAIGALGMIAIAAVLALPWYIYTLARVQEMAGRLLGEYTAHRDKFQPPYYYIGIVGLVLPWTLWFLAGLAQPFLRAEGLERRRRLFAWVWLVGLLVIMSIPGAKQQRYLLPLMPAAALIAAQVLRDHETAARQGRPDPGSPPLYSLHWAILLIASFLVGPLLHSHNKLAALTERLGGEGPLTAPISSGLAAALTVAAVFIACLGWYWHRRGRVLRAGVTAAVWTVVVSFVAWHAYAALPRFDTSAEPQRIAALIDGSPVYYLIPTDHNAKPINRQEKFALFSRRLYRPLTPAELTGGAVPPGGFVITEATPEHDAIIEQTGYIPITVHDPAGDHRPNDFFCDNGAPYRLWRRPPAAP